MGVITQPYGDARRAIGRRLADIPDAVQAGDLERLAGHHPDSPKFFEYTDSPPLERQDIATAMEAGAADVGALDEIRGAFEGVKIDVFGPAAVVTGPFVDEASAGGDRLSGRVPLHRAAGRRRR